MRKRRAFAALNVFKAWQNEVLCTVRVPSLTKGYTGHLIVYQVIIESLLRLFVFVVQPNRQNYRLQK